MYLPQSTWQEIAPHFIEAFPQEAIAVVWSDYSWQIIANTHPEPTKSFSMGDDDRAEITEREDEVLVLLHSHPNGNQAPSYKDMVNQMACGFPWGISVVSGDHNTGEAWHAEYPEIWGDSAPAAPLQGREHLWGIRDCYSIVRDYRRSQGFECPNFPRFINPDIPGAPTWAADQIVHQTREAGFVQISIGERRPGDAFTQCCGTRGPYVHDHCGIYLGEGKYLHQPLNRRSEIYEPHNLEERWLARHDTKFWRPEGDTK